MRFKPLSLALAVLAAGSLVACSGGKGSSSSTTTTTTTTQSSPAASPAAPGSSSAAAAGASPAASPAPKAKGGGPQLPDECDTRSDTGNAELRRARAGLGQHALARVSRRLGPDLRTHQAREVHVPARCGKRRRSGGRALTMAAAPWPSLRPRRCQPSAYSATRRQRPAYIKAGRSVFGRLRTPPSKSIRNYTVG